MANKPFETQDGIKILTGDDIVDENGNSLLGGGTTVSKFVVINDTGTVWGSNDGENWTGPYNTGLTYLGKVAVGPNMVVYIGGEGGPGGSSIYYTTAWNVAPVQVTDSETASWSQVRYFTNIERFVAVGNIDGTPCYKHSTNGINWTVVSLDNTWAATLDNGAGYNGASFNDIATNGTGFLLITDDTILGSFYTTTLTTNSNIGSSEWLNDGMSFERVVYSSQAEFTGWFAFGDGNTGADDGWWLNSEHNPGTGSFSTSWGISDISLAFKDEVGYEPSWSELVIGRYNGIDTIVIGTSNGQILYWPAVPDGPFLSIPKVYTSSISNITVTNPAVLSWSDGTIDSSTNEKIVISNLQGYNGTYYINSANELYTNIEMTLPFDATSLTYTSGGTVTFSHGMYIDALNYANGKFYVANDSEEIFVSADGGATWTEVASLTGEAGVGEGLGFMNDIDGYVSTGSIDTGNFTFSADTITNGNGMLVATDRGTLAIGTDMEFPGAPSHFHIAFDGSNTTVSGNDLFFGDDFNYVLVSAYANGVEIGTNDRDGGSQHTWNLTNDGQMTFPTLTVPISDNATPTGTGQTIKFSDPAQQAIIYGPASTTDYNNAERIIIQGAPGYTDTTGEGGDVYLWAGPGGSAGGDGGDIKIRAGRGIAAGGGGYLNFQAGDAGAGAGATGGYINIESGSSANGTGGNITIDANSGGQLALYTAAGGNITLNTAGGVNTWTFDSTGKTTLPGAVVNSTVTNTVSAARAPLYLGDSSYTVPLVDGNYGPFTLSDIVFTVQVLTGAAIYTITNVLNNATFTLNQVIGTLDAGDLGGTPGNTANIDISELVQVPLDLTKSVNKLADGTYSLADGVEGQIMYLVRQTGSTYNSITVNVANARVDGTLYTTIDYYPFDNGLPALNMSTLIFTDGAWQASNGGWD